MKKFTDLGDYLSKYETNPNLAAVPISVVADYYKITPASVTSRIKKNKLSGVYIGKVPLVLIKSILDEEKKELEDIEKVEKLLEKLVIDGKSRVFYEPVMAEIGLKTTIPSHRSKIGKILAKVSKKSKKEHDILLSALVHRKGAGSTMPGEGFFNLAENLGYSWEYDDEFVQEETEKILKKLTS